MRNYHRIPKIHVFYIAQYLAYLIIRRIINTQLWSGRT